MNNKIIVPINLFDLNQTIYINNKRYCSVGLHNLGEVITDAANETGTNEVLLFGNREYCERIKQEIFESNIKNYNNIIDLKVEIQED